FRPHLEVLEDRCLPASGLTFSAVPQSVAVGSTLCIRLSESPPQRSANPVVLTLIDPLGLAHLVGSAQATPDANGQVFFQNIAIDYVGLNLRIRATIANTKVSVTSDPLLVYALPTPTKDQVNLFEGAYQTLEGGLPYPESLQWMARHIAQNYDASLFTH